MFCNYRVLGPSPGHPEILFCFFKITAVRQVHFIGGIAMIRNAARICFGLLLFVMSPAPGETSTVWNPPPSSGSTTALWTDAANWSGSIPTGGPNGNYKVQFYNSNRRDCILNQTRAINHLVMGDGGSGVHVLRLASGGHLTAGIRPDGSRVWTGIGWGSNATLIVEEGASLTTGDHLWVGHVNHCVGTVILEGGTVNITQMFGLNFDNHANASGRVIVNGGVLNLSNWHAVQSIRSNSYLDVSGGTVYISGDRLAVLEPLIADGRIRAYNGQGKVVYDYNVTSLGKTTITGMPPVEGDLNEDFGVDIVDLLIMAEDWLKYDCHSPANLDAWCRVDLQDFSILAKNWLGGFVTRWHVASTEYPTDDWVVTPISANSFGIVADGQTDVTKAIQNALLFLHNIGGGTLFLPSGMYKVSGTLTVPSQVTLRGDWRIPSPNSPVTGTVLMAYAGRGDNDLEGTPFIGLSNCAGVKGLTIWYPEQTADNIQPYPPAIRRVDGSNHSVENVTFVNAYIGFSNFENHRITASPFLRHIYGTPLKTGIEFDCLADVGRIETVHFSPAYWKHSGLPGAPTADEHAGWLYENAVGVVFGRIDWSYAAYVTVEGYNQGLRLHPTRNEGNVGSLPNGQCYRFDLKNCKTGVYVEGSASVGFMFTRFDISGAETGMFFASASNGQALIHTCRIEASGHALNNNGTGKIQAISSTFDCGEIRAHRGYIAVTNSDFNSPEGSHILVNYNVQGAAFQGNRFSRSPVITVYSPNTILIDHSPVAVAPLPTYEFKKPERAYTAAKTDVFVVTDPPYNASTNQTSDATAAFQAALDAAGANGGGIVFVPGGDYRLDGTLIVPMGVELRGVFDLGFSPSGRGSVLNTYHGKNQENGSPFIQLEPRSGIRGVTIHHAGQIYDASDTEFFGLTPYPFMIRGLGEEVYVISVAATIPWQLLDLATYRCDRHYVDNVLGTAMKTGIHVGGGSVDGHIHNCQFNPSAFVFQRWAYASIPTSGDLDGVYQLAWRQAVPYLFGHVSGQVIHHNFVFGGNIGAHLVSEGDSGPSGHCMGLGIDQCTTSIRVDGVGEHGLDMINSQIVTVDYQNGCYLETGPSLTNTFRMFSTCCWGGSERGIRINGGDVELQLCQIENWGWVVDTAYEVGVGAQLRTIGSNMTQPLNTFLQMAPSGSISVISNMIRINSAGMPVDNGTNLRTRGNLRIQ